MAASDYTIRDGNFALAPNAMLLGAVSELQTVWPIERMQHVSTASGDLRKGMGIMVQDEICRLETFTDTSITVSRGCADTIPQKHTDGAMVWFFDGWSGSDEREYLAGEIIGVKPLPFTSGGTTLPIESVPPQRLIFNQRFYRPYAPGLLQCRGQNWFTMATLDLASGDLEYTWKHRDRVTQADVLVSHTEDNVGPEVGVTYTIEVYNSSGTLKATHDSLSGNSWTYTLAEAQTDFDITPGTGPAFLEGYITLKAMRDGVESWQFYKAPFKVSNEVSP